MCFDYLSLRRRDQGMRVYSPPIRIKEKKMETTIVYWGYIGIMETKMETPI